MISISVKGERKQLTSKQSTTNQTKCIIRAFYWKKVKLSLCLT